jgi:hypothetical protein
MADNDDIVQKIRIELEEGDFRGAVGTIKGAFDDLAKSISDALGGSDLTDIFDKLENAAKSSFESIKEQGEQAFKALEDASGADLTTPFEELKDGASEAFDAIKEAGTKTFEAIKEITKSGDIGSLFSKLKEIGSTAFSEIAQAASKGFEAVRSIGASSLSGLANIFNGVKSEIVASLGAIGITGGTVALALGAAFTAITVAAGIAAKKLLEFTLEQSRSINELSDLSDKTHTAVKDLSELETAYAHAGVSAKEFADGYEHLSDVVGKTWEKIKKDSESGVDTLEQKSIAAARAAGALSKIENERKQTPLNNPDLGKPIQPFAGDLNTAETQQRAIEKELELRQARLASREAERAENDARRNDLSQVAKGVQELISGNQNALKQFNATADNIVKGVVATAGQAASTMDKLGDSFADVGSKAPEIKSVLEILGNTLQKIPDPALRSQVALAALGKSGTAFLGALDSGRLPEFIANVQKLGGTADEASAKIANNLKGALTGLKQDLSNIGQSIATAFGPAFTDAIKAFDDFLVRNQASIKTFAEAIGSGLGGAVKLVTNLFVTLTETIGGTVDLLGRFGKLLDDFEKNRGFKVLGEDIKQVYETLKAVDDVTSKNEEQRKRGAEKLAELRKADEEAEKKKASNQKLGIEVGPKTPTQDEWDQLSEDEKQAFTRKVRENQERATEPKRPTNEPAPAPAQEPNFLDRSAQGLNKAGNFIGSNVIEGAQKLFQDLESLLGRFNSEGSTKVEGPVTGLGIRGDAGDATKQLANAAELPVEPLGNLGTAAKEPVEPLKQLTDAAASAVAALNSVQANNDNAKTTQEESSVAAADGGHIRGPGGPTSDSIPAMLSDGEYVVRASAVGRVGVAFLDAINEGRAHFAQGGTVRKKRPDGKIEETATGVDGRVLLKTTYDSEADLPESKKSQKDDSVQRAKDYFEKHRGQPDVNGNVPQGYISENGTFIPSGPDVNGNYDTSSSGRDVNGNYDTSSSGRDVNGNYDTSSSGRDVNGNYDGRARQQQQQQRSNGSKEGSLTQTVGRLNPSLVESLNAASEAEGESDPNFIPILLAEGKKKKRHFALGGLVSDSITEALSNFQMPKMPRLAEGGSVSLAPRLPRFAEGGLMTPGSEITKASMQYLGTVDLTTNHGNISVGVSRNGLSDLRRAAVLKNLGSSPKSSWVK